MLKESLLTGAPRQVLADGASAPVLTNNIERIIINRDLSLLEFFRRVLSEGVETQQPLLERLKFLSIFSSNLDEFFMIRVPGLKENVDDPSILPDGMTTAQVLDEIRRRVSEMVAVQTDSLKNELLPKLAENGIGILKYRELSNEKRAAMDQYFTQKVYPVLTPQAVDPTHPFPYISGGSLNLGLFVNPKLHQRVARALNLDGKEMFVRIKIPSFVPRFVPVEEGLDEFVLIEDLIRSNIHLLISEATPEQCHEFRITRDADVDLREAEAEDLLQMMEDNLRKRRFGDVVRLEVCSSMSREMVDYLSESLEIVSDDVYEISGPLNLTDFFFMTGLKRSDLKDRPLKTTRPDALANGEPVFDVIKRGDVLLHHPYMPYTVVTDFIKEAAEDPDVLAIKMCLYRIGEKSPIPPLLIKASEMGKQVTVVIEIKARFDEANNIEWGKRLERAGVHVIYGLMGLKTHSKASLVVRREAENLQTYVHVATGNYNPETSAVYTDLGILTADPEIGEDATELFNFLTVYSQRKDFKKLLVAPLNLRERMLSLIDRETEHAKNGLPAKIIAKFNRLADIEIVQALYRASSAGVQIDLIVRGVCTLRPGVQGLSENIRVRSVVGRLLEHSRVYYFENAGQPEVYVGSSDWMPRNLDRRVEVLSPVCNPGIRKYLKDEYLGSYLNDNSKAWELNVDGSYTRVSRRDGEEVRNSQLHFQNGSNVVDFLYKK